MNQYKAFISALLLSAAALVEAVEPVTLVRAAIELACNVKSRDDLKYLGARLPGIDSKKTTTVVTRLTTGRRRHIEFPAGELIIDWIAPKGQLYQIRVQYNRGQTERTPQLLAVVDARCQVRSAKRMHHDNNGIPEWLEHLDENFKRKGERELLNPAVPNHPDVNGVTVALIDTGVNYLLPQINTRLARDRRGRILGYDYWDLDQRPFDFHPTRSIFFPGRHGTQIASIMLQQASAIRLLPYRYPRPAMARMATLIDEVARHGGRLVNLSLVSHHREDWLPFIAAAQRYPDILFFIAAGNKRRNIDERPMYPAAFSLENLIVVTAANQLGQLVQTVNWGPQSVDLMVPAENIEVTDYDGTTLAVTGSSYATARVTALAACLLAKHRYRSADELKAAIFALARSTDETDRVAVGFIDESRLLACHSTR